MKFIHRRDADLLSPIKPEDLEFAKKIESEYNIPLDKLSWLIRDTRDEINDNKESFKRISRFRPLYEKCKKILFAPDVEIKEINITTNKGELKIKSSDPFFDLFAFSVKKTRSNFRKSQSEEDEYSERWSKESPMNKITYFFLDHYEMIPKKTDQIRVIAKFFAHFRLYKEERIVLEDEYNNDLSLAKKYDDYNDYLYSRGKSLLKKYLPGEELYFIDDPGGQT